MAGDVARDDGRKLFAIDRQRGARRHAARLRRPHHERSEPPHFFLQKTDGVIELVAAERIAAHELRETISLVDRGRPNGPHLVQRDRHAARRGLPGGFGSGKTAAHDRDPHQCTVLFRAGLRRAGLRRDRERPALAGAADSTAAVGRAPRRLRGRARRRRRGPGAVFRRASSRPRASSSDTVAGSTPRGMDAFVSPSVTYGPYRPSSTWIATPPSVASIWRITRFAICRRPARFGSANSASARSS